MKSNRSQIIFVVVIAIALIVVALGLILRGVSNSATTVNPADTSIVLTAPVDLEHGAMTTFNAKNLPELEYPSDEVVAHILDVFHQVKKQATVLVIVDTSGSMSGEKIKGAVDGALSFLDNMEPNERVIVYIFSSEITPLEPTGRVGDVREQLKQTVGGLYAGGGTALHEVVIRALDEVVHHRLRRGCQRATATNAGESIQRQEIQG